MQCEHSQLVPTATFTRTGTSTLSVCVALKSTKLTFVFDRKCCHQLSRNEQPKRKKMERKAHRETEQNAKNEMQLELSHGSSYRAHDGHYSLFLQLIFFISKFSVFCLVLVSALMNIMQLADSCTAIKQSPHKTGALFILGAVHCRLSCVIWSFRANKILCSTEESLGNSFKIRKIGSLENCMELWLLWQPSASLCWMQIGHVSLASVFQRIF